MKAFNITMGVINVGMITLFLSLGLWFIVPFPVISLVCVILLNL